MSNAEQDPFIANPAFDPALASDLDTVCAMSFDYLKGLPAEMPRKLEVACMSGSVAMYETQYQGAEDEDDAMRSCCSLVMLGPDHQRLFVLIVNGARSAFSLPDQDPALARSVCQDLIDAQQGKGGVRLILRHLQTVLFSPETIPFAQNYRLYEDERNTYLPVVDVVKDVMDERRLEAPYMERCFERKISETEHLYIGGFEALSYQPDVNDELPPALSVQLTDTARNKVYILIQEQDGECKLIVNDYDSEVEDAGQEEDYVHPAERLISVLTDLAIARAQKTL